MLTADMDSDQCRWLANKTQNKYHHMERVVLEVLLKYPEPYK